MSRPKNILFVCGKNKLRSPTAEAVFCDHPDWSVRSAGINNDAEVMVSTEDVLWADYILVMEQVHMTKIKKRFRSVLKNQKLICLDIPDKFAYMDESLVNLLKNKMQKLKL